VGRLVVAKFDEKQEKQLIGQTGEHVAVRFLEHRGYKIVEQNYRKKWGEIDIITEKNGVLHFVEVKASVSNPRDGISGNRETYRPEENIREWKKQRLSRAIRTYFAERKIPDEQEFEIDVISVLLDFKIKKARIRMVSNVVLEQ